MLKKSATLFVVIAFALNASAILIDRLLEKTVDSKCKMAIIEARKGNYAKAEALLKNALTQTRNAPDVLSDYIRILSWQRKYPEILIFAAKFAKDAGIKEDVPSIIATAPLKTGFYKQALTFYKLALKKKPGNSSYIAGYVEACVKLNRYEEAHEIISRRYGDASFLSKERKFFLDAQMSYIFHRQAVYEARNGKFKEALRHIRRAAELSLDKRPVIVDMIVILAWSGRYREALLNFRGLELTMMQSFSSSKKSSPPNKYAEETMRDAQSQIDKSLPPYLLKTVAWSACQMGDFETGAKLYARDLKIHPQDADVAKALKHANMMIEKKRQNIRAKQISGISPRPLKKPNAKMIDSKVDAGIYKNTKKPDEARLSDSRSNLLKKTTLKKANATRTSILKSNQRFTRLLDLAERKSSRVINTMKLYEELLRTGKSGKTNWATVLGMDPEVYDQALDFVRKAGENGTIPADVVNAGVPRIRHGKALALARSGKTKNALEIMADLHGQAPNDISFLSDYLVLLSWNAEWKKTGSVYIKLPNKLKTQLPAYSLLEVSTAYTRTGNNDAAVEIIEKVLADDPKNIHAWTLLGAVRKRQRKFMSAYKAFARAAELSHGQINAMDAKYRLLADVMAVEGAKKLIRSTGEKVSPEITTILDANEASLRIQWKEPKEAIVLLDRNLKDAGVADPEHPTKKEMENPVARRAFFDRILAYDHAKEMTKATRDVDLLEAYEITMPIWLTGASADALLYLKRPEEALKKCDIALVNLSKSGRNHYPDNVTILMLKYYALIDLERHDDAKKIIDKLAESLPSYAVIDGVYRKNWDAVTALDESAWWYNYNNQPDIAAEKFSNLLDQAPNNSNFLTGLAYSHYYRGWPRMAHEEFSMAKTVEPENISAQIGYCRTLNELDQGTKAREIAAELAKKKPRDLRIKRLERDLELQDMRTISLDMVGSTTTWDSWFNIKLRLEQPIEAYRSVYTETEWMYRKRSHGEEKKNYKGHLVRGRAGANWRLSRNWYSRIGISFPLDGSDDVGGSAGLTYKDDYWTISTDFNSRTTDMPSRALHEGLYGINWASSINYRTSEKFNATISYRNLYLSDHNDMNQVGLTLDRQIYSSAHVEGRLALLNDLEMWKHKNPEAGYYSPRLAYTCQIAPMIEHTWYKRYDTSFTNRLTCGGGFKTEKDFNVSPVGFAKFEEDCRFTDTFGIIVGSTVSYDTEDGDGSMGLAVFMKLQWRF